MLERYTLGVFPARPKRTRPKTVCFSVEVGKTGSLFSNAVLVGPLKATRDYSYIDYLLNPCFKMALDTA